MKKYFILGLLFVVLSSSIGIAGETDKGIQFKNLTVDQARALAAKEGKLVFLHGFADWCGHCKTMKEEVYVQQPVGDFYNKNFVCIKMDMEKEGKELAQKLKISKYPTLVFFDSKGDVMHRATGEYNAEKMIELGKVAVNPEGRLKFFQDRFNSGTATPTETYTYLRMVLIAGMESQSKINKYLTAQPVDQLSSYLNWRMISDLITDSRLPILKTIIARRNDFAAKYSADSIDNKIIGTYNADLMKMVQRLDSVGFEKYKQEIKTTVPELGEKIADLADINKLKLKGQYSQYFIEAPKYIAKYGMTNARRLNEIAREYAERCNDPKQLAEAEVWSKKAVQLHDHYRHNHVLAQIQQKLGKKEDALATAKHAVELGKKSNIDYKQTLLIIDKLENP